MWRRWGVSLAMAVGIVVLASPAAHAEDPVDLNGAYVLDTVGAISGDESRVQAAIDSLYERARIQLFVVYVDSFTGASDGDWANETAVQNGLGSSDVLLAVATEDRNFEISVADDFVLDDSQLATVETNFLIPQLRDDNWAEAAIAAADGYAAEATGVVGPISPGAPVDENTDDNTGATISPALPIVGGIAVIGVGVFVVSRLRKRGSTADSGAGRVTQKELDTRSGSLLVQLDDSLKTSEQELGFAVAQFGDAATAEFTTALDSARGKVAEAFTLRQKLDDSEPESDAEKREWTTTIIRLCEAADAELDAQADAFDALRELEKNAPQALDSVTADRSATAGSVDSARAALSALGERYSPAAIVAVNGNVEQAETLLEFVDTTAAQARQALGAGRPGEAAVAVRSAQASLGQANQLVAAIDTLGVNLAEAGAALDAAIADTTQDVTAAKALPADTVSAAIAPEIAAAESALSATSTADPIASLAELEKANAALEGVFIGARDTQQQVIRARSQLDATLASARAQALSANEFITTRRGGVGSAARTRASEADRHLAQATALVATDPVAALAEAQQASQLAAAALDYARADVSSFESQSQAGGGSYADSGYRGSGGADLGGILTGWLLGGGGGGGGSWGGGGSSGSYRSGSSRSSRSGSFGGSSRSSSRSSGSRSSGRSSGGRSSRGGRF